MKQAKMEDLHRLIDSARWFHGKTQMIGEFVDADFLEFWSEALGNGSGMVLFAESENEVIEAIGIKFGRAMSNKNELVAVVPFWYVKDNREGLGSALMFNRMLAILEEIGIFKVSVSALYDFQFEKTSVFLERAGFKAKEVFFQRKVTNV